MAEDKNKRMLSKAADKYISRVEYMGSVPVQSQVVEGENVACDG